MSAKPFFAFLNVIICFFSQTAMASLQANIASKTPLSFFDLRNGQSIRFCVCTDKPPASFLVEVSSKPQPQVKIQLLVTATFYLRKVEKMWGHHAGEEVTRPLTPEDLQKLEKFLMAYRSKGRAEAPASSGKPMMVFEFVVTRTNKEGFKRPDVDGSEFYNCSKELERDFVKNFIGVN